MRVEIKAAPDTLVRVEQHDPSVVLNVEHGQELPLAKWTRVEVVEGRPESVLCFLVGN